MKIGVYGYFKELEEIVDFFELKPMELSLLPRRSLLRLRGQSVLIAGAPHVYRFDTEAWREWVETIEPIAWVWSLPNAFEVRGEFSRLSDLTAQVLPKNLSIYWDSRMSTHSGVFDPLAPPGWPQAEPKASKSHYWRIHGWHSERWMRRYSPERLQSLNKLALKHRPNFLSFAHSQRAEQVKELRKLGLG